MRRRRREDLCAVLLADCGLRVTSAAAPPRKSRGQKNSRLPNLFLPPCKQGNVAAAAEDKAVDFGAMHAAKAAEDTPVDDGSGVLTIWRVEDFKKVIETT